MGIVNRITDWVYQQSQHCREIAGEMIRNYKMRDLGYRIREFERLEKEGTLAKMTMSEFEEYFGITEVSYEI